MDPVYEIHAPKDFPMTKEQPAIEEESAMPEAKPPFKKEALERWKKDVLDKIQYLKENLEQAEQDKQALYKELDLLNEELSSLKDHTREVEKQLAENMDSFNQLLNEVTEALKD
jgi:chromosome segregation ATPase